MRVATQALGNKWARERTGAHEGDTQALPLPSRVSLARTGPFFLAPMYFLSAYYATLSLGARDFSSAISGFCQVFVMARYPGYQRLFLACDQELRRPQPDSTRAAKPREKTSGAERLDLLYWMDLDLVSNLSIKSKVAS